MTPTSLERGIRWLQYTSATLAAAALFVVVGGIAFTATDGEPIRVETLALCLGVSAAILWGASLWLARRNNDEEAEEDSAAAR